jgi:hypothetical protein
MTRKTALQAAPFEPTEASYEALSALLPPGRECRSTFGIPA